MKANSETIYEIKLNRTMDFITANTAFYRFLGKRLYATMDKIMPEEDIEINTDKIFNQSTDSCFTMRLFEENGKLIDVVVRIKSIDSEDMRTIICAGVENLYDYYVDIKNRVKDYSIFLSQFDCVYFIYNKADDSIEMFKMNPEYNHVASKKLTEFERDYEELSPERKAMCDECLSAIRNGKRGFNLPVCEEFANHAIDGENLRISGVAVYEEGAHIRTLGNISTIDNDVFYKVVNKDQLTGLMLKEDITSYVSNRINLEKKPTTIAIIDIDNFKAVNDNYGHMKGDETLRKCASIMEREIAGYGKAGRIGGDEFFVVIEHDTIEESTDEELIRTILRSVKNDIFSLYSDEKDGFHISASIGAASFPSDAGTYEELFLVADFLLYRAKSKGKNRYIKYDPAKHDPVEVIVSEKKGSNSKGITGRKGVPKSEIVCKILDNIYNSADYGIENIFKNIMEYFGVERMVIYDATDKCIAYQCGNNPVPEDMVNEAFDIMDDPTLMGFCKNGEIVINNIKRFQDSGKLFDTLKKLNITSFMQHRILGNDGRNYIISYESLAGITVWNTEDFYLYRILDRIFEKQFHKAGFDAIAKKEGTYN